jgi:prepilin-type processing-associated H-X9-DG protein/prepilin-type N-terminal cleavage/methylation domain-containing protein
MDGKERRTIEPPGARSARGFTLVELLTVIAVLGALAALLIPSLRSGLAAARRAQCASNLRQMAIAAHAIALESEGDLPPSYERDFSTRETTTWESFLWDLGADFQIQQCPSFRGAANWSGDRYTGYNYNASYLGGRLLRRGAERLPSSLPSANLSMIGRPQECAIFGDGEYEGGANKFMRSPWPGALDADAALALGGTQGFRHGEKTNAAFVDGHVESLAERHTATAAPGSPAEGCGFLSSDNRLYDLE